jgi:hypothetical protein
MLLTQTSSEILSLTTVCILRKLCGHCSNLCGKPTAILDFFLRDAFFATFKKRITM